MTSKTGVMRQFTAALAAALSEETGSEWRTDGHCSTAWTSRLFGSGDLSLLLDFGNYETPRERVAVSGIYPRNQRGETPQHKDVRITVNRLRGHQCVARDIAQRFMPRYLEQIELCRQRIARDNRDDEERAGLAAQLAQLSGGCVSDERLRHLMTFALPGGTGEFQLAAGDWVKLSISSDDPQLLRRLAKAIGSAASTL